MDKALKQRLVGATVLIALAVVILPMLLGGRPEGDGRESRRIELPAQPPELDFETRRYPIGEQERPQPQSTEPADEPPPRLPEPDRTPDRMPDVVADTAPEPEPEPKSEAEPQLEPDSEAGIEAETVPEQTMIAPDVVGESPGRYVVQVASFGSVANANRMSESLQAQGYSVLVDTVKSDSGMLSRVRVGPFGSEAAADDAVVRLREQISGINPRVVDLQPDQAAQVSKPVDPLIRWVVQVGSFSNAANAEGLVARLRLEGHTAYQESVEGSSATIHRVRVGPFLDRDEAIRIERQIQERMGLDGVVMSAD